MTPSEITLLMQKMGKLAKDSATILGYAKSEDKALALSVAAESIQDNKTKIIEANLIDIEFSINKSQPDSLIDRLRLNDDRIKAMAESLKVISSQSDPVGRVLSEWSMPSGINIKRIKTPLGVIGVIFESRPNVTADAGALCLKSGNSVILRCGSDSFNSSVAIHSCLVDGLRAANLPLEAIQLVPTKSRAAVSSMLSMVDYIDVIVPRGGKGLVSLIQREARVPVFAHLEGIVHIYIDKDADLKKTLAVILNSKTRRTGICGAAECLLIHKDIANSIGREVIELLLKTGVRVNADENLIFINGTNLATSDNWGKEYLDMEISAKTVGSLEEAMSHIREFGSQHTDCIMTENDEAASTFLTRLDSSIVMHNVSTQFSDGGEFGMGAEIGIATGKMHARGPIGADQLTSFKYVVAGNGAVRK
ncbi:MAG: glutamate-5-semialdehyde dehydrogenase [Paracoccaceae bacterium]|jgi:glutamate-5-semialdehyde dehydrogenase